MIPTSVTPQMKIAGLGLAVGLIAKFAFNQDAAKATTYGLAAIAVWSLLSAHNDHVAANSDDQA